VGLQSRRALTHAGAPQAKRDRGHRSDSPGRRLVPASFIREGGGGGGRERGSTPDGA